MGLFLYVSGSLVDVSGGTVALSLSRNGLTSEKFSRPSECDVILEFYQAVSEGGGGVS